VAGAYEGGNDVSSSMKDGDFDQVDKARPLVSPTRGLS
jgi:hypothetical protein